MALVDVVCGMEVEPPATELTSEYKGKTYYFCGAGCKASFDNAPWKLTAPLRRVEATVTRRIDISPRLFILWIRPAERMPFKPGYYVVAVYPDSVHTHCYTMVSAPHEKDLEIYVELVPYGEFTPILHGLRVGDTMHVRHTNGRFVFRPDYTEHVMVAQRHTIAPFISMLREHLHERRNGHRFHVLYGDEYRDELAYHDELSRMAARAPEAVRYVPVVSQARDPRNRDWSGEVGEVNAVAERYLRTSGLDATRTLVYVAGYDRTVDDLKARATALGYAVSTEPWWHDEGHGSH